jgi:hypothetical protein
MESLPSEREPVVLAPPTNRSLTFNSWRPPGGSGEDPVSPRFLNLRGQRLALFTGGDLLPSKQVVAGSIPVSRSTLD